MPDFANAHLELGFALLPVDRAGAEASLRTVLKLDPQSIAARLSSPSLQR